MSKSSSILLSLHLNEINSGSANLPLSLYTSYLTKNFGGLTDLAKKADWHNPIHPHPKSLHTAEVTAKHMSGYKATMSDKSVETLGSKIRFSAFWNISPPYPKTMLIFLFFSSAQTTAPTQH